MTEEEIRADERRRIELMLAILMLPDHDYLWNTIVGTIQKMPLMPTRAELSGAPVQRTRR